MLKEIRRREDMYNDGSQVAFVIRVCQPITQQTNSSEKLTELRLVLFLLLWILEILTDYKISVE